MSVRLVQFSERSGVLPTTQFGYGNGLGTGDAYLCVPHRLQSEWRVGIRGKDFAD